ncbi:LysR family transcriptional regulator [Caenimonas koreensis]|uniref:LysR family transcriptional regulator n=1 Tax=Caenimonas koreensis DSM 17982 TaxID=1121255 RepID=A0A844BCY7_9BURK|nr:LysR family transcriptional regulator [Caenimonas koreensis]MRD49549.1 LysR family transcriptional regulator [Caenimonas koreensis DSM 17982]
MDRLQSMRVFQQVVDEGGFAAAARRLDMAPAAVTRLVVDLETHLGVRLLQRTTRRLSLTPAGEDYLSRVRSILEDIAEADASAQTHRKEMSGTMRVLAPPGIAAHVVAPAAARFQQVHPEVMFDIHVEDAADPAIEDYDMTLLPGTVSLRSGVVARTIIDTQIVFCASPHYLAAHGTPATPQDLAQHRMLRMRTPGVRLRPLVVVDPRKPGADIEIEVTAFMTANHSDTLLRAALEGAGITAQPEELIAPHLKSGNLQRVLAPWITARLTVVAALPSRKFMPARTRAFLDHLVEYAKRSVADVRAMDAPVKRAKK